MDPDASSSLFNAKIYFLWSSVVTSSNSLSSCLINYVTVKMWRSWFLTSAIFSLSTKILSLFLCAFYMNIFDIFECVKLMFTSFWSWSLKNALYNNLGCACWCLWLQFKLAAKQHMPFISSWNPYGSQIRKLDVESNPTKWNAWKIVISFHFHQMKWIPGRQTSCTSFQYKIRSDIPWRSQQGVTY